GGKRDRRRLPDRIFVHGLRAVLAGRIWQRAADVRAERRAVLGRLAAPDRLGAALRHPRHLLDAREDPVLLLRLLLGEGHGPALPLRPADAAGLEDLPAAVAAVGVHRFRVADAHPLFGRAVMSLAHYVKTFTLWEFVKAHWL